MGVGPENIQVDPSHHPRAKLLFTPWRWQEAQESDQSVTRQPPSTCFHICKMGRITDTSGKVFWGFLENVCSW